MTPHDTPAGAGARLRTPLTALLGIDHPVLSAPMGDTAGGRLAAAVSAAGGIADGRGLAAALALGAAGVTMGTRFLASAEATSTPAEAAALVTSRGEDTIRTEVIDLVRGPEWPPGHDGRVVRNALVERWHDDRAGLLARRDELRAAYLDSAPDDHSMRALWAGEGLDLVTSIPAAGEIVADVVVAVAAARLRAGAAAVVEP